MQIEREPLAAVPPGNPSFHLLKQLLHGLSTFLPRGGAPLASPGGNTQSARYCYAVWLRHLVLAGQHGLNTDPQVVSELGPGNSLGIGLAALISGAHTCYALDVVPHTNLASNLPVFDELCSLFEQRAPIPDQTEFPLLKPVLERYDFPTHLLDETRMATALSPARLQQLRAALQTPSPDGPIQYQAPWDDPRVVRDGTVDMILSQAVLEHVDDLPHTYAAMARWLKPDGFMSHQIDFKCHGWAKQWNGHWCYGDLTWKVLRGKQTFAINRAPCSEHLKALNKSGMQVGYAQLATTESSLEPADLAARFRKMPQEDLVTCGAFIQASPGEFKRCAQDH